MAVKKITRRWLLNSFAVIVLIVVALVAGVSIGISQYYYNYVRQTLVNRADTTRSIFTQYAQDQAVTDFSAQVQDYVSSFPVKEQMELMTIDADGKIGVTSSGFVPDEISLQDYQRAFDSELGVGVDTGKMSGQRVMAVTLVASLEGEPSLSAVRLITSLENIDRQVAVIILMISLLGLGVLALNLFSSSYFISSIVNPVGQVGETARRIAGGDFGARLEKRTDDEIGELCDIINYMAGELEATEQLKNDFISSVSHELRTPLTAIQGWGETLLADGGQDKAVLDRGMNIIINETGRLAGMVEELLDFSRMQSGRLKLVRSKIDAIAELSEAVLMYTERAKRENIELTFEGEELIAPVYGDKNKLRQVFVNIIDNAIKYSDNGDSVVVTATCEDDWLTIQVRDSGIGIAKEDLPRIKTKFYKANTTRRGSGIGLAVADEIVTRHEGTLSVESEYGVGTTVTIGLPIYRGSEEMAQIDLPGEEAQVAPADEKANQ